MSRVEEFIAKMAKFGIVGVSGIFVDFSITWILKEKSEAE